MKNFLLKPKIYIPLFFSLALIATMFISDIYYTKLEKEYPLLVKKDNVYGKITSNKDHFNYTYIEVDNKIKRLIRPIKNDNYSPAVFSDFILNGDVIKYEINKNQIEIIRAENTYFFNLDSDFFK